MSTLTGVTSPLPPSRLRPSGLRRAESCKPLVLCFHDPLPLLAQALDPERDHVAFVQEVRRLHAEPDARRRAGDDDVARLHHEELRAVPHQMLAAEDHGLGRAALALLAVDVEPHRQVLWVLDLVFGDEPGPDRPEALAAFALVPLAARALDLEHALGHVVRHEIAGDGVLGLAALEVARALADDDAELDLPVELARLARDDGVVVGAADARRRLVEDDRLLRDRHAG